MTQKNYNWLSEFINSFEDLEDKTHNTRCDIIKTKDLIQNQENTFKNCLNDIHKRLSKLEANEGDLIEIKSDLYEIYQRIGLIEIKEVKRFEGVQE